ncbi:MAG TPA: hypothetical protein DGT23_00265 [Micromonosporaceae bacterium]|nr:hypothetical protein [Micromonosporaceae bacterium]
MKVLVWIVSALVALAFLAVGAGKLVASAADLASNAHGVPVALLRIAGITEVLGALGLILPAATRIMPALTPVAAAGLALQMLAASIVNVFTKQYGAIAMTALLLVLTAWIAWARFGRYAIEPRSAPVPQAS